MKKKDEIILWPVYFDSTKTRSEGRRVPKKIAVPAPNLEEIEKAAELLGFKPKIVSDAAHPRLSWQKMGVVVLPKKNSKSQITRKIIKKILESRMNKKKNQVSKT
ncbi:signal recognition particle protein Srp19 [Candidatus Bathyarchaeota archaeon]|nr:signal recognition particle protein Srp19 [Candidatus Bathyarchaeota archaeon]